MGSAGVEIGRRIKWLRTANSRTLDDVARGIGSTKGHLSGLENGKVPSPGVQQIARIAEYFGVTVSWIIGEKNPFDCFQASQFFMAFNECLKPDDWGLLWLVAKRLAEKEQADG